MLITTGEKMHIVMRRRFAEDIRRHFAGTVTEAEGAVVRIDGYAFVFDSRKNQFMKKTEIRHSIFDIAAEGYIVNILPPDVEIKDLRYQVSEQGDLVFTDNKRFSLDINEFGVNR